LQRFSKQMTKPAHNKDDCDETKDEQEEDQNPKREVSSLNNSIFTLDRQSIKLNFKPVHGIRLMTFTESKFSKQAFLAPVWKSFALLSKRGEFHPSWDPDVTSTYSLIEALNNADIKWFVSSKFCSETSLTL
jgi:hypothetical protein